MNRAMKRTLIFLVTALLMLCVSTALAGQAYPGIVDFTESATGDIVQIRNYGDEHFSYMADTDGNLLVQDASGYLRYVTEGGSAYALGGYKTQATERTSGTNVNVNHRASGLQGKLETLLNELSATRTEGNGDTPDRIPLRYDFVGDRAEGRAQVCTTAEDDFLDDSTKYPAMESTCPLLVLKLQFKDIKCIFSDQAWHDRIFENGITQYYSTVSNGKFTYEPVRETWGTANDGVITVTLPFNCPRYAIADESNQLMQNDPASGLYHGDDGKNYALYNMGSLYAYAMLAAEDSIDFASFDRNGDGFISPTELAVLVVYSGYEASFSGAQASQGKPAVWAHSWKYNNMISNGSDENYHYMTMLVDGKRVSKYTVVGELANYVEEYDYETATGTPRQAQYGTATHELGHDMGLPDLYATSSDPVSQDVGGLSLMASGSWGATEDGDPGSSPTHLDPMSKIFLGFYTATSTDSTGDYTLYATEPSAMYNILRVNTADPNVYYLIENRQFIGYDAGLTLFYPPREGGLVVWRADQAVLDSDWYDNTINNVDGHYGLMPVFVDDDPDVLDPFWSLDSVPSLAELQSSPKLTFSALSKPGTSMNLNIDVELLFTDDAAFNIPSLIVNTPMKALDVSRGVSGGKAPYTFALSHAPAWLTISKAGVLTGTPTALSAATTAVVTVTDALGRTASLTLDVGAVTNAPTPPQTGDAQPLTFYAALLMLSLAGLLWSRLRKHAAHR